MISLAIVFPVGESITVSLPSSASTVLECKQAIRRSNPKFCDDVSTVFGSDIRLMHIGVCLEDDARTLKSYGIVESNATRTIFCLLQKRNTSTSPPSWFVNIEFLNGEKVKVNVDPTATVQEFKQAIKQQVTERDLRNSSLDLEYRSVYLEEDARSLESYGIVNKGSTVQMKAMKFSVSLLLSNRQSSYMNVTVPFSASVFECKQAIQAIQSDLDVRHQRLLHRGSALINDDTRALKSYAADSLTALELFMSKDKESVRKSCQKTSGRALQCADDSLKDDYEFVMEIVSTYGRALEYASPRLRDNYDVVNAACCCDYEDVYGFEMKEHFKSTILKYASKRLQDEKRTVTNACKISHGRALEYASPKLKDDKAVAKMACELSGGEALKHGSSELRDNKDFILEVICQPNCDMTLKFASPRLQDDEDVVRAACRRYKHALHYASPRIRDSTSFILEEVGERGGALKFASNRLRDDKDLAIAAFNASSWGWTLQHASKRLRDDYDVVLLAVQKSASDNFQYASTRLKDDDTIVSTAVRESGVFLEYASKRLRDTKAIVSVAVQQSGLAFEYASMYVRDDKEIFLAATESSNFSKTFPHASTRLRDDSETILAAVKEKGFLLKFASARARDDTTIVMVACRNDPLSINYASPRHHSNKNCVMDLCRRCGSVLKHLGNEMKSDKDVVMAAIESHPNNIEHAVRSLQHDPDCVAASQRRAIEKCKQDGHIFERLNRELRANKRVVMAAVASNPNMLKFALGGLNQDPDCLVASGLWDTDYDGMDTATAIDNPNSSIPRIVLSTRFALAENSTSRATQFAVILKRHEFIQSRKFRVYSPNAFAKSTCDPNWTDYEWPCRGTYETCRKNPALRTGIPQPESCWRYSFRCQLQGAKTANGFMIQLVEVAKKYDGSSTYGAPQTLGDGQKIERDMGSSMSVKIFRVHAPISGHDRASEKEHDFTIENINTVVESIKQWYDGNCQDTSEIVIQFFKVEGQTEDTAITSSVPSDYALG